MVTTHLSSEGEGSNTLTNGQVHPGTRRPYETSAEGTLCCTQKQTNKQWGP